MSEELTVLADGDGLAVVGDPALVQQFLDELQLPSRELGMNRLSTRLSAAAGATQAASEAATGSGRWVKLTKESAAKVKKFGLTPTDTKGVSHAMVGPRGSMKSWIQLDSRAVSQLTNPALLSGAAGIMAQLAMQQAMNEITDYLEAIDEKLDDVLRAQKTAALAPMRGTAFVIEEAMAIREARGRVDDITWSKLDGRSGTVADVQAYAIDQMDALAERLERKSAVGDLAEASAAVRGEIQEWLAVLARCFQLRDAIAVLELDRVLDASPEELDAHRLGLQRARQLRLDRIGAATQSSLARLDAAAEAANAKVLIHPSKAPAVARNCCAASTAVIQLNDALGIEHRATVTGARRWTRAVRDTGGKALTTGAAGAGAAKRASGGAARRTKSAGGKVAGRARGLRRGGGSDE